MKKWWLSNPPLVHNEKMARDGPMPAPRALALPVCHAAHMGRGLLGKEGMRVRMHNRGLLPCSSARVLQMTGAPLWLGSWVLPFHKLPLEFPLLC